MAHLSARRVYHGSDCPHRVNRRNMDGNMSYKLLMVVAVLILVLNINQMLRLESSPLASLSMFQLSSPPSTITAYFQSQKRLYRSIPPPGGLQKDITKAGDFIYFKQEERWDASPIVIERFRLVFFTIPKVGCTVWKQLFRRMMNSSDWQSQDESTWMPHNPDVNGLKYLYDYPLEQASKMMTSPEWTRAIMVRDPKERFLSAFLDKAVSNFHTHIRNRCCLDSSCVPGSQTLLGFLKLCQVCEDDHWRPQHDRMDSKYWPYVDWVGHVEAAAKDAERLLRQIGAWEEFGASGWGDGNSSIFEIKEVAGAGEHATWAQWQVWKWYTPEVEELVERFYQQDYENPKMNLTRGVCLTCT